MLKVLVIALLASLVRIQPAFSQRVFECGVSQTIDNVIKTHDGNNTVRGAWPWHVAIYVVEESNEKYICGGTLVTHKHILTAAHCVKEAIRNEETLLVDNIFVELGVHQLNSTDSEIQRRMLRQIHSIDSFQNQSFKDDIAILELNAEAEFGPYVQPACLSLKRKFIGQNGIVLGWGFDKRDQISTALKSTQLPVVDPVTCLLSNRVVFGGRVQRGIFCAGHMNGTAICNGDSGGGMFFEEDGAWHLAGIVSFSQPQKDRSKRCYVNGFAGFSKIHTYLSWIESVTKLKLPTDEDECKLQNVDENANYANLLPRNCGLVKIGNETQSNDSYQIPWMAMLLKYRRTPYDEVCAGSLIHKRYVLAATFCASPREITRVQLGLDCNSGECAFTSLYGIDCVVKHPTTINILENHVSTDYNDELHTSDYIALMQTDIALVRLDRDVIFDDLIRPICLPVTSTLRNLALSEYLVAGWTLPPNVTFYKGPATARRICQNSRQGLNCSFDGVLSLDKSYQTDLCWFSVGSPLWSHVQYNGMRFVQFGLIFNSLLNCSLPHATAIAQQMSWILANIHP